MDHCLDAGNFYFAIGGVKRWWICALSECSRGHILRSSKTDIYFNFVIFWGKMFYIEIFILDRHDASVNCTKCDKGFYKNTTSREMCHACEIGESVIL